jgi:tRNA(Arg) A34 adenosine deaminase TadA
MKQIYINEAISNANKSSLQCSNHGAVVIYRGKIVGRGYNKQKTENINRINRWTIHAEVDAIQDALLNISKEDLKKSILVVVRVMKEGHTGMSAPCSRCSKYIKRCGIPTCYYSKDIN